MDILYGLALSLHLGFEQDYNMIHPHIRLKHDDYIAGAYYNSEDVLSLYAGLEFEQENWNYEFGVVTGYSSDRIYPFFRSTYDLNDNIIGYITPAIEGDTVGLILGLEFWNQ
jgi:hypothetical protein